ncbi:MAG: hypothetical protein ACXWGX_14420 [Usitatibacter sp.]
MSLWADSGDPGARFGPSRKGPGHLVAVERLKDWTRARFALAPDEVIVVSEMARSLPGYPPLETVVGFWTAGASRHHFTVFKRVEEVVESDLPPRWMKDALADSEGIECECC